MRENRGGRHDIKENNLAYGNLVEVGKQSTVQELEKNEIAIRTASFKGMIDKLTKIGTETPPPIC